MNNQLTSLSFSVHSNKGVYALLLGSGISKSSGIPTGWDIQIDLIKRLSNSIRENCGDSAEQWYRNKYHQEPSYSQILSKLVKTPSERVNLLKPYFEKTDDESDVALKQPTNAHKAIAQLVKKGYIKVIITTNFDRLLEKALQEEDINPTVIRNIHDITGAFPLIHSDFTLIKVNGDYLDSRFLNTDDELSDYPLEMKTFLLEIINNFGLITCGWSGKWDTGLANTITQASNFRFPSYFSFVNEVEIELNELATHRKGELIKITDADTFFTELKERVEALESYNSNHPLNKDIAIARLKKYIAKSDGIILYHDLIIDEVERTLVKINGECNYNTYLTSEIFSKYFSIHKKSLEILLPMCITAIQWLEPKHEQTIINVITRLSELPPMIQNSYNSETIKTHYFSALILFYTLGIIAIKYDKFTILNKLVNSTIPENNYGYDNNGFLINVLNPILFDRDTLRTLLNVRHFTPLSTLLYSELREYLKDVCRSDSDYEYSFVIFECLMSLNYMNLVDDHYAPLGEIKWRYNRWSREPDNAYNKFFEKANQERENWEPIKAGMFYGTYAKYSTLKMNFDVYVSKRLDIG